MNEKRIYDFDKEIDLSSPWLWKRSGMKSQYGASDLIPLSSADMDFDDLEAKLKTADILYARPVILRAECGHMMN